MKRISFIAILLIITILLIPNISHARPDEMYDPLLDKVYNPVDHSLSISEDGLIQSSDNTGPGLYWRELLNKYKVFAIGIAAFAATSMIFVFIMSFMRLGASAGNPNDRKKAITGIMVSGISAALLGGVGILTALLYNIF